jgi:cytidylate kinase
MTQNLSTVIAIDGPSASGKSSVSQMVADALDYLHVDTGSMYRALTWKVLEDGINPKDANAVIQLLNRLDYKCDFIKNQRGSLSLRNLIDGKDLGSELRSPVVEENVSSVSAIPEVRSFLVQKQRELSQKGELVVEGRDIGTVVFPETPYKFFLEADPEVRARRRAKDQIALGTTEVKVGSVGKAINERDRKDSTRTVAPLKIAEDAIRIDTSDHTVEHTADIILKLIRSKHLELQR